MIAVLYEGPSAEHVAAIAHLREELARPFRVNRHEVFLTLSLGEVDSREDGGNAETLLRKADCRAAVGRARGGDQLVPYSAHLQTQTLERLDMEADLQHAIERGELALHTSRSRTSRPARCGASRRCCAGSARAAWSRRRSSIPLAEESGLIVPIGAWVFEQACHQARLWNEGRAEPVVIAVNVSMRQFQQAGFLDTIRHGLACPASIRNTWRSRLTESTAMQDPEKVMAVLEALRGLGLALAIDDFGTGYSGLAYLKRFPLNKLKTDQSFVRGMSLDPKANPSMRTRLVGLAHSMQAERCWPRASRRSEQRARLVEMGCERDPELFLRPPAGGGRARRFLALHDKPRGADRDGADGRDKRQQRPALGLSFPALAAA